MKVTAFLILLAAPLAAWAKQARFDELVSAISAPVAAEAGSDVPVEVQTDVEGYCDARSDWGLAERDTCLQWVTPGLQEPYLRWIRDGIDWESPDWSQSEIDLYLAETAEGLYRGSLKLPPCQLSGTYRPQFVPEAAQVALEVTGGPGDCSKDVAPPRVTALLVSPQTRPGGRAEIKVEVEDDFAGAFEVQAIYLLGSSRSRLGCERCGVRWLCRDWAECAYSSERTVYIEQVRDGAGRKIAFNFFEDMPAAKFTCGAQSDVPAPLAPCEAPALPREASPGTPHPATPEIETPSEAGAGCSCAGGPLSPAAGLFVLLALRRRRGLGRA